MPHHKESVQILAIRHGETDWNADARMQGQTDIPLNQTGLHQAQQLALHLAQTPIDLIYSSDLARAHATAQALAEHRSTPIILNQGLRERHFGSFQGHTFNDIEEASPEAAQRWLTRDLDFTPNLSTNEVPQGESLRQFAERVTHTFTALMAQNSGKTIAVVTHGGVLDILYRNATGIALQAPRTWSLSNTSINRFSWDEHHGLKLLSWGEVTHLDQAPVPFHNDPAQLDAAKNLTDGI